MKKAALFVGGWEGHKPQEFCDWAVELLEGEDFEVTSYDTLAPLAEPEHLADVDLIVPIWSSARSSHQEEFGNMNAAEERGMLQLIANGCGIAGWHGHMGDAFRDHSSYHFLIGGQFVAHPPGWPDNLDPTADYVDYDVTITKPHDPIVEGISSFRLKSEQYYMLVDPSNDVLGRTPLVDRGHSYPCRVEATMGQGPSLLLLTWPRDRRPSDSSGDRDHASRHALGSRRSARLTRRRS